jgi:Tfp pilus assembly protein PilP
LLSLVFLCCTDCIAWADDPGAGGEKDVSIEDYLQQLSTVPGVLQRKDPFADLTPPFAAELANLESDEYANMPNFSAPALERYPITDYEVAAVLLGDKYPRALVRIPGGDKEKKVVIIKEGDRIGNHKGAVSKIQLEGIIVTQEVKSARGFVDKGEVLLRVGGKADDQRKQLSVNQSNGASGG